MLKACECMLGKAVTAEGRTVGVASSIGLATNLECEYINMHVTLTGHGVPLHVGSEVSIDGCHVGTCVAIDHYQMQTEITIMMSDETVDNLREYVHIMSVMQ